MKYCYVFFLVIFSIPFSSLAEEKYSLLIVANIQQDNIHITRREVRNLFMGVAIKYHLNAVSLPSENELTVLFNTKVVGLTESRIQSYWAQMRFTGRKKQPKKIDSEKQMIEYLKNNKDSIAYISGNSTIPSELTILLKIK